MKNHTDKLPFGCAQCNLGFKQKSDLMKHCETAHSGILMLQENEDDSVIQYVFEDSEYTVVNVSDDFDKTARILTLNEDGSTTLMVENEPQEDDKKIVFLRIQDEPELK